MAKLDDLIEKATSAAVGIKATKAKRSALARAHHHVLKHYDRQRGGSGEKYDADKLLDQLEDDDFQLEAEHANAAEHEITAHAVSKAVPTIGGSYKQLIKSYADENDPDKKAEIGKQLDLYREMGPRVGINREVMETLKRDGFTPEGLYQVVDAVDTQIRGLDRRAFIQQIPAEVAYAAVDELAKKHSKLHHGKKFNPERVKSLGADAARSVLLIDREVRGDDDAFYEAAKQYYLKSK